MLASNRLLPIVLSLIAAGALTACGSQPAPEATGEAVAADEGDGDWDGPGVELDGRGSFSCDFSLTAGLSLAQVGPVIERDRMLMAGQPGMITKHLPIVIDPSTGNFFSGGRYLFDTFEHAKEYADFVEHGYVLDGVQFLQRPYFVGPECFPWRVVGARRFASIEHQLVLRTERFQATDDGGDLRDVYHAAVAEAARRGLTAVWLVENREQGLTQLVYYIDRVDPPDPTTPDFASLGALAGAPPLGDAVAPASWQRIFDRTHWILVREREETPGLSARRAPP
jgi:hypothetical protein